MASIKVPPLGESIVEATVSRWLKQEGDAVSTGDTLVELETDKITVEVAAQESGVLSTLSVKEGDVVNVGDSLGEIGAGGGQTAGGQSSESRSSGGQSTGAASSAGQPQQREPVSAASGDSGAGGTGAGGAIASGAGKQGGAPESFVAAPGDGVQSGAPVARGHGNADNDAGGVKISPAASRIAAESGLDIGRVVGTGRGGVVSKPDVLGALNAQSSASAGAAAAPELGSERPASASAPAPAPAAPKQSSASESPAAATAKSSQGAPDPAARETREKMSTRRRRIAENLLQSQHMTAHLTTFNEIDMTEIMSLRERLKERLEKEKGVKLSYMPFFTKAACLALKAYPLVNSQLDGDHIVYKHYVNMGVAVASEAGLVVPNVKDADSKSLIEIGNEIGAVAKRARDGKLTMDDLTGGTFTITNGGVFGSLISTPIINYPQTGILGLHKIQDRVMAIDGKVEIRPMMYVALSYDHRIIDGQQAVLFLVRIKELMEDPAAMLVF